MHATSRTPLPSTSASRRLASSLATKIGHLLLPPAHDSQTGGNTDIRKQGQRHVCSQTKSSGESWWRWTYLGQTLRQLGGSIAVAEPASIASAQLLGCFVAPAATTTTGTTTTTTTATTRGSTATNTCTGCCKAVVTVPIPVRVRQRLIVVGTHGTQRRGRPMVVPPHV